MKSLFLAALLFCAAAQAGPASDGVDLVTQAGLNKNAIESNVINVTDPKGKLHRFAGTKKTTPEGVDVWVGKAGPGTNAVITRHGAAMSGYIDLGSDGTFNLTRTGLVKFDPGKKDTSREPPRPKFTPVPGTGQ